MIHTFMNMPEDLKNRQPLLKPLQTPGRYRNPDVEQQIREMLQCGPQERLRRAKVINAMGEQQAAEKLVEAGRALAQEPQAMQLRYFAALHDIAGERSSTVVFPLPMNLLDHLTRRSEAT